MKDTISIPQQAFLGQFEKLCSSSGPNLSTAISRLAVSCGFRNNINLNDKSFCSENPLHVVLSSEVSKVSEGRFLAILLTLGTHVFRKSDSSIPNDARERLEKFFEHLQGDHRTNFNCAELIFYTAIDHVLELETENQTTTWRQQE